MRLRTLCCLLPSLASTLSAQAPAIEGIDPGDARIAVHTHVDQPGDAPYGIWAAGAGYKASFHGGMTFYPELGRDYPHNQPLAWRTTSVRVGGDELLAGRTEHPPTWSDHRVEYALGPVIEAYDVLAAGLEQSFVFRQRPAGSGDLRITGTLTTGLWTQPIEDHDGDLVFRDAQGTPLIGYGRAVAIDADGDRFVVTTTCIGNRLTLRLAAEALAAADFPLVVDPMLVALTVVTLTNATGPGDIDAAAESQHLNYNAAMCVTRHFSATDADVLVYSCNINLSSPAQRYTDLSAAASADHGRVAFVAATNKWVLCYQNFIPQTQLMQLRVAMWSSGTPTPITTTSIPHLLPPGMHEWRPVVGGIAAGGAGNQALIAFQQENGPTAFANTTNSKVMGMLFDTSTTLGVYGVPFVIRGLANEDTERPSINRAAEGGTAFSWFVVSQRYNNTELTPYWRLAGYRVDNTGTVATTGLWIGSPSGQHSLGPIVDGRAGRYLVTYTTADAATPKPADVLGTAVRCERLDWPHGSPTLVGLSLPAQTLQTSAFRLLETSGIAFDGGTRSHWAMAWRSSSTAPAIYATRVGYRGVPLQTPDLVESTGLFVPGWPTVVHSDPSGSTTIGYQRHDAGLAEVRRRTWDLPTPANSTASAMGCASGFVNWTGPANAQGHNQRIGCEFSQLTVTGAPANSLHLVLVATATTNIPILDPIVGANCALLVPASGPDYLGMLPLAVGSNASWTLPLPEFLPTMTLQFQDWMLDPADNRFRGSDRRSVPLVR